MSGRTIRTAARISFFLCGLTSLSTAAPYVMLRGAELPVQSEWVIFVAVLAVVGLFSLAFAILPRSWFAKLCRKNRDDAQLFLAPLKWLGAFAALAYLAALFAFLAPHEWNLTPQLMFSICPLYFVKMTFDPSPIATFFLLAPMNAAVYGALGVILACAWLALRQRAQQTEP
jgi:hypothetical protein